MERIEYLLNHPTAVEGSDLELLNNEIEKYPYFYSLRALKLSALKKIKDESFENQLPLTATYSNDRKDLFQFIHGKPENHFETVSNEVKVETTLAEEETISDSETSEEVENNWMEDNKVSEKTTVEEINEEVEVVASITDDTFTEKLMDEVPSPEPIPLEEVVEENFSPNERDESITAEEIQADHPEENMNRESNQEEILPIVEEVTDEAFYEEIVTEPTIESLIEEIKQESVSIPVDEELISFDLPQPPFEDEVEKSVGIAEDLLLDNEVITTAIKETHEIQIPSFEKKEIEQVSLVNRANEIKPTTVQPEEIRPVANINIFQIQNTFDEVKGSIIPPIPPIPDVAPMVDEIQPIAVEPIKNIEAESEINTERIESLQPEIDAAVEDTLPETEIKSELENKPQIEPNSSLSFNEWLKRPMGETIDATTQKEIKYQIIDEFLEKNPKITPIKKQDIPESKIDVKEIKQTDYSDLMTETLAQIYIEQKQYEKAIRAYKILSLKYPEKNSLFANQIKEIENLKNSK